jgi:hypothetical protein
MKELNCNSSDLIVKKDSNVYTVHEGQTNFSAVIIIPSGDESKADKTLNCLQMESKVRRHGFLKQVAPLLHGGYSLIIDTDNHK